MRNTKNVTLATVAVLAAMLLGVMQPQVAAAQTNTSDVSCDRKVAVINYRSELLKAYKKKGDSNYKAQRSRWAERVRYAGQWVPKQAEQTRAKLYAYDALHAATNKELVKQINAYHYLEAAPLDCAHTSQDEIIKKMAEVKGVKNGKVIGGNALIGQLKKKETAYIRKEFTPTNDSMIKKLHQAKAKHSKPQHAALTVKDV